MKCLWTRYRRRANVDRELLTSRNGRKIWKTCFVSWESVEETRARQRDDVAASDSHFSFSMPAHPPTRPITVLLSPSPPRQPPTGDGLSLIFRRPIVGENTLSISTPPPFLSVESRKFSALFNCRSPHPSPTLPSRMPFPQGRLDDAIPRLQHVTAYRREIPANDATGRLLNLPSLYSPVIS
jgi:hypothetical protein